MFRLTRGIATKGRPRSWLFRCPLRYINSDRRTCFCARERPAYRRTAPLRPTTSPLSYERICENRKVDSVLCRTRKSASWQLWYERRWDALSFPPPVQKGASRHHRGFQWEFQPSSNRINLLSVHLRCQRRDYPVDRARASEPSEAHLALPRRTHGCSASLTLGLKAGMRDAEIKTLTLARSIFQRTSLPLD